MYELGARVRAARQDKGMSQSDLARATGLSPGAVSRIEAGEREPGSATLGRLAQALGSEVGVLMGQDRPVRPQAVSEHDGEVLEAIQLIAQSMPSLPVAGRRRVLQVLRAVLS